MSLVKVLGIAAVIMLRWGSVDTFSDATCKKGSHVPKFCPRKCRCGKYDGKLEVNCRAQQLQRIPSRLPWNTASIQLSGNDITSVVPNAFYGCDLLDNVDLSFNQIQWMSNESFANLTQLTRLKLEGNQLNFSLVPVGIFRHLKSLRVLSLHNNSITPPEAFFSGEIFRPLRELQALRMDGRTGVEFGQGFAQLSSLNTLTIETELGRVENNTFAAFNTSQVSTLSLNARDITAIDALGLSHFKNLDMFIISFHPKLARQTFKPTWMGWYGLKFTKLTQLLLFGQLKSKHLYSPIQLNRYSLRHLKSLKIVRLNLEYVNLVLIDVLLKEYLPHLKSISLTQNSLALDGVDMMNFLVLPELTYVEVSYQYNTFYRGYGSCGGDLQLTKADASRTWLQMYRMLEMVVQDSNSSSLANIPAYRNSSDSSTPGERLLQIYSKSLHGYISKQLAKDSAEIQAIARSVEQFRQKQTLSKEGPMLPPVILPKNFESFYCIRGISMSQTSSLGSMFFVRSCHVQRINFANANIHHLIGPIYMPCGTLRNLSLYLDYNEMSTILPQFFSDIAQDVTGLMIQHNLLGRQMDEDVNGTTFEFLTRLEKLDLSYNSITTLAKEIFIKQTEMKNLSLTHNSLRQITFDFTRMKKLRLLNLSSNLLEELSQDTMATLDMLAESGEESQLDVNLMGNPLVCSCHSLPFLQWMLHTKVRLLDNSSYECSFNGSLTKMANLPAIVRQLQIACSSELWLEISAGVLAFTIVMLVVAGCLWRHRYDVQYMCIELVRRRKTYQALNDEDTEYKYDAFVSYDTDDNRWIKDHLIPNLEEECEDPLKLCVHFREFLPGTPIKENVLRGMQESRKIILVLSRTFLASEWCHFELEMASICCRETGKDLIVPVLLEDLSRCGDMPRTLGLLLRRNTYIELPTNPQEVPNFWLSLKEALSCVAGPLYSQRNIN